MLVYIFKTQGVSECRSTHHTGSEMGNLPAPKTAILRSNLSPILYEPILLVSGVDEREKGTRRETGIKERRFAQEEGDKPLDRRIGEKSWAIWEIQDLMWRNRAGRGQALGRSVGCGEVEVERYRRSRYTYGLLSTRS